MHTNAGEGEDGGAGRSHEERTRELETGKGAMFAVPFRSATVAMAAVPRRVVCIGKGGRKKKEVKMWRDARNYAPCGANFEKVHGASPWRGFRAPRRGALYTQKFRR